MRVRDNKPKFERTVMVCVTLSMLSGCIFSSNFGSGEGGDGTAPDMPASMVDMMVAPPDQDSASDQGMPVDLSDMTSMADQGMSTDAGGSADLGEDMNAACTLPCHDHERCVIRDNDEQACVLRSSCEAVWVGVRCRAGTECGALQYSCDESDFKQESCPNVMGDAICSSIKGDVSGRVSGLALGVRQVVVTYEDGALDPVVYVKPEKEGWREETPQLPSNMDIQMALLGQGKVVNVDEILHKGVAAAISSDDSVIALTVTLKTTVVTRTPQTKAQNAVLLFTGANTPSPKLSDIVLGDGEYFATSLEIESDYLLAGSPQLMGTQNGYVSLYKWDGMTLDRVGRCVGSSQSFGKDLGLASFGANVPFVYASSDEGVSQCADMRETSDDVRAEEISDLDEGSYAISVSGNRLLVSGPPDQPVAHVYMLNATSGRPMEDAKRFYQTSHGAADRVFAVINATGNRPTDAPQIVFDIEGGVEVAPAGHTPTIDESSPFDAYQKLYPTPLANEILAMDANAEGVVVFAVPRGTNGATSDVVFGRVPQDTGN